MPNPSVGNIVRWPPHMFNCPSKLRKATVLVDVPHRIQRVGVVRQQVVLGIRRPLNAERASLIRQRKWLDTLKRFALYVAV